MGLLMHVRTKLHEKSLQICIDISLRTISELCLLDASSIAKKCVVSSRVASSRVAVFTLVNYPVCSFYQKLFVVVHRARLTLQHSRMIIAADRGHVGWGACVSGATPREAIAKRWPHCLHFERRR